MINQRSISWIQRACAALSYAGAFPFLMRGAPRQRSPFLLHHARQAAALALVLFFLSALFSAAVALLSYALVFHREPYESLGLDAYVLGFLRKLFLAWLVFWLFALGMALLGAARPMPLVQWIAKKNALLRLASALTLAIMALGILAIPLALHAGALAPPDRTAGDVYMIYEDNGVFPRWIFALGFYPMARAARQIYGPEAPVLQPISRDAITNAIAHGKLVFVGSHGTKRGLMLKHEWLLPEDFRNAPKHPGLKLVYLTGCDSGEQRDAWADAFAPARVVTYDRLSAVLEHVWWLWVTGPKTLKNLAQESQNAR